MKEMVKRTWVSAVLAGLLVLLGTGLLSSQTDAGSPAEAAPGVHYQLTARSETGDILFTTNTALAEPTTRNTTSGSVGDFLASEPYVLDALRERRPGATGPFGLEHAELVQGLREGETRKVDVWAREPLSKIYKIPKEIGPVETKFGIYRDTLFQNRNTLAIDLPEDPDRLTVGSTWTYLDILEVEVVDYLHGNEVVLLEIQSPANGTVVTSRMLGFPVGISGPTGDTVHLDPQLQVGTQFETAGCGLPSGTIHPGSYTVIGETTDSFIVEGWNLTPEEPTDPVARVELHLEVVDINQPRTSGPVWDWIP